MIVIGELDQSCPSATDGEIAAENLESARRGAWARFVRDARFPGVAEAVVEKECIAAQFFSDLTALDRLDALASQFTRVDDSFRAALVHTQAASSAHRFGEARAHLVRAERLGGPPEAIELHALTIDQACGRQLEAVLASRSRIAAASGRLEDRVPFGALLADLGRFEEADAVYQQAFYSHEGISPFPLAWVCFQLGMLWGEIVPAPDTARAALWYRRALIYLPAYVKARVHLAEICARERQVDEAEALLLPALSSGDPEVQWRLADVLIAQDRLEEAEAQLVAAQLGFETLLRKHLLAFADHAAEFYAGSGDFQRALELARTNIANRPTSRAHRQVHAI